jgi:hypothetical protein
MEYGIAWQDLSIQLRMRIQHMKAEQRRKFVAQMSKQFAYAFLQGKLAGGAPSLPAEERHWLAAKAATHPEVQRAFTSFTASVFDKSK